MQTSTIQSLDKYIERLFFSSGCVEGYEKLKKEYATFSEELKIDFGKVTEELDFLEGKYHEIECPCMEEPEDICFEQMKIATLIGMVAKNVLEVYVSLDIEKTAVTEKLRLLGRHEIFFEVSDPEKQYADYPKSKQRIVHFIRDYRTSVFPAMTESLYCCAYSEIKRDRTQETQSLKNLIRHGFIVGGSTGFVHFIGIFEECGIISFQIHGDTIFDIKSLHVIYPNVIASAGKDGCIYLSDIFRKRKLVQMKDFISTSPMAQVTCLDIDLGYNYILSCCGDGTLQVWEINEEVKKRITKLKNSKDEDYLVVEKALHNYQVQAQEDIMHTVQVIQCLFYGKFILYITSQGYITLGTFLKSDKNTQLDSTGKSLNFFPIANFDFGQKLTCYDKILFLDQNLGIFLTAGHEKKIQIFDLKERAQDDLQSNYSDTLASFELPAKFCRGKPFRKIYLNVLHKILTIITENSILRLSY